MEEVEFEDMTVYSTHNLDYFFEVVKAECVRKPYFAIHEEHFDGECFYNCAISSKPLRYNSATTCFFTIDL